MAVLLRADGNQRQLWHGLKISFGGRWLFNWRIAGLDSDRRAGGMDCPADVATCRIWRDPLVIWGIRAGGACPLFPIYISVQIPRAGVEMARRIDNPVAPASHGRRFAGGLMWLKQFSAATPKMTRWLSLLFLLRPPVDVRAPWLLEPGLVDEATVEGRPVQPLLTQASPRRPEPTVSIPGTAAAVAGTSGTQPQAIAGRRPIENDAFRCACLPSWKW